MAGPKITIPNLSRIRATVDTTVGDAFQRVVQYIGRNTTPAAGTRRAAPTSSTHPIVPKNP
jgi:hypothetical protein